MCFLTTFLEHLFIDCVVFQVVEEGIRDGLDIEVERERGRERERGEAEQRKERDSEKEAYDTLFSEIERLRRIMKGK